VSIDDVCRKTNIRQQTYARCCRTYGRFLFLPNAELTD
jgi:hypothetical protein